MTVPYTAEPAVRRVAFFTAPAPAGLRPGLPDDELRRALRDSTGPPPLADQLRAALAGRGVGTVSTLPTTAVHGLFEVEDDGARAGVFVGWSPQSGRWGVVVSSKRRRLRGRPRRRTDEDLAATLATHLHETLPSLDGVAGVRWLTDDEARATEF